MKRFLKKLHIMEHNCLIVIRGRIIGTGGQGIKDADRNAGFIHQHFHRPVGFRGFDDHRRVFLPGNQGKNPGETGSGKIVIMLLVDNGSHLQAAGFGKTMTFRPASFIPSRRVSSRASSRSRSPARLS